MSRVASWLAESTTMISNGGSWTTKLSSNAAMFLASLRTVATTMRQVAGVTKDADLVIVHGDTNTTVAGALLAKKEERRLAHVGAGIPCFDKTMREELNRIVADELSDVLFAPTATSRKNLGQENVTAGVHVVGNSVIDALIQNLAIAEKKSDVLARLGLTRRGYMLLTFHRAENVDVKEQLARALKAFEEAADEAGLPIVFPIHPRTAKRLQEFGLEKQAAALPSLRRIDPTGYLDMLILEKEAAIVMTDSGGLQEESCFFRVPCVTLRENTERPETLQIGSNVLAGTDPARGRAAVRHQLGAKREGANPFGDGASGKQTAQRVAAFLG